MFGATLRRGGAIWLLAGAVALNTVVGLAARRAWLAQEAHSGRYALVAMYIVAAGALCAVLIAMFAPRRPFITGLLAGFLAPLVAAGVTFQPEYDPGWWPIALAIVVLTGTVGALVGIIVRWTIRRDRPPRLPSGA